MATNNSIKPQKNLSAIFYINGEMKEGNGEDNYFCGYSETDSVVAVFDGCGGIGSRRYGNYSGKTGAYIASRAVSGAVSHWFTNDKDEDSLSDYIKNALDVCSKYADKSGRMIGSLGKSFPTTAALIHVKENDVFCHWAGDSRCYLLDDEGLHQLSLDDIDGEDAFSNITSDGVLTNVICGSSSFVLHKRKLPLNEPCLFITATDGCFGYLPTPFDFEYLITETLTGAKSIEEWRMALDSSIRDFTGDDYTMCISAYGFTDFSHIKKHFTSRNKELKNKYINSKADNDEKWEIYKKDYLKYL